MGNDGPKLIGIKSTALQERRPPDRQSYDPLLQRNVRNGVPLPPVYSKQAGPQRKTSSTWQVATAILLCIVLILSFQTYLTVREDAQRFGTISSILTKLQSQNSTTRTMVTFSTSTTVTTITTLATSTTLTTRTINTTVTVQTTSLQQEWADAFGHNI